MRMAASSSTTLFVERATPFQLSVADPPHQGAYDAESVDELAAYLIASAHHREVVLLEALLRWRHRREQRETQRLRLERVAISFFNQRLQFMTYRAWRWAFTDVVQRRAHWGIAVSFAEGHAVGVGLCRVPLRAWRRFANERRSQRQRASGLEVMTARRGLLCASCNAGQHRLGSSHRHALLVVSDVSPQFTAWWCRWRCFARMQRNSRRLSTEAVHHLTRAFLQRWSASVFAVVKPRRFLNDENRKRLELQCLLAAWIQWRASARATKLRRWSAITQPYPITTSGALTLCTLKTAAESALIRRTLLHWRRWTAFRQCFRVSEALHRRSRFREWLLLIGRLRLQRHQSELAVITFERNLLRRVFFAPLRRRISHRHDAVIASAFLRSRTRSREVANMRQALRTWKHRTHVATVRRSLTEKAVQLRKSLLAVLAVRRLADYHVNRGHLHQHPSPSDNKRNEPLRVTISGSSIFGGGEFASMPSPANVSLFPSTMPSVASPMVAPPPPPHFSSRCRPPIPLHHAYESSTSTPPQATWRSPSLSAPPLEAPSDMPKPLDALRRRTSPSSAMIFAGPLHPPIADGTTENGLASATIEGDMRRLKHLLVQFETMKRSLDAAPQTVEALLLQRDAMSSAALLASGPSVHAESIASLDATITHLRRQRETLVAIRSEIRLLQSKLQQAITAASR